MLNNSLDTWKKSDVLGGVYIAIVEFHCRFGEKGMKPAEKCGEPLIVASDSWKLINRTRTGNK